MNPANELKDVLLSMLESAFPTTDIVATQQMGINMSNSVKRDGVVIIQNQNVEIYARIMPPLVKALKLCDSFELPPVIECQSVLKQITPQTEDDTDPIDECCAWLYENSIGWEDMQELMKARYAVYVTSKFPTSNEAAKFLDIGSTYLSKITSLLRAGKKVGHNRKKEKENEKTHKLAIV